MKTFSIRNHPMIRLSGRFDPAQEGFPMLWSAASAEMNVRGRFAGSADQLHLPRIQALSFF